MAKQSSKNNNLLGSVKRTTSPKIYSLLGELVNADREDLAQVVLRIDYLLKYTSKCINDKDFVEAREALQKAEERIATVREENFNTEYLEYLAEGIKGKVK